MTILGILLAGATAVVLALGSPESENKDLQVEYVNQPIPVKNNMTIDVRFVLRSAEDKKVLFSGAVAPNSETLAFFKPDELNCEAKIEASVNGGTNFHPVEGNLCRYNGERDEVTLNLFPMPAVTHTTVD